MTEVGEAGMTQKAPLQGRHPREGGDPPVRCPQWIPAFAGMTERGKAGMTEMGKWNDGNGEGGNDGGGIILFAEFNQSCRCINAIMQVAPLGIKRLYHGDLPLPQPFLELLFTLDGGFHCVMVFIPDEQLDPYFWVKPFIDPSLWVATRFHSAPVTPM